MCTEFISAKTNVYVMARLTCTIIDVGCGIIILTLAIASTISIAISIVVIVVVILTIVFIIVARINLIAIRNDIIKDVFRTKIGFP